MEGSSKLLRLLSKSKRIKRETERPMVIMDQPTDRREFDSNSINVSNIRNSLATRHPADVGSRLKFTDFMEYVRRTSFRERMLFDVLPIGIGDYKPRTLKGDSYQKRSQDETVEEEAKWWIRRFREKIENTNGNRGWKGSFFALYVHLIPGYEHIHIIHDCTFGGSQCKCAFMAGVPVRRRQSKYIRASASLGVEFWRSFTRYYFPCTEGGRDNFFVYLAGRGMFNVLDNDDPSMEECKKSATEGCMDCPDSTLQDLHWEKQSQDGSSSTDVDNGSNPSDGSQSKCRCPVPTNHEKTCIPAILKGLQKEEKEIFLFLINNLISPPSSCVNTWAWIQSGIRTRETDPQFKHAIATYKKWVRLLTLTELVNFYADKKRTYAAIDREVSQAYWDVEESTKKLEYYLEQQFYQPDLAYDFMVILYKQQTRQGGKKGNTIWLKGPQDSAKSWFVDSLKGLQITYGGASILNKSNHFALSACVDCRVIILDEFNFDPVAYTDKIKLLFSGNNLQASVKYKDDGIVLSTPVIIISNGDCIPDNPIFNSRMTKYEWHGVDVSKYTPIVFDSSAPAGAVHPFFTKSLHPESFIAYWKKHNIWDQVFQTSVIDLEEGEQ